jgi:predicted kinase
MAKAKLILINGFNASGKTTIANLYIANHSLAMAVDTDGLVDGIGDWVHHREEVGRLSFELTKALIRTYLPYGHDVVLPYIVTTMQEAQDFESIAAECGADYYEVVLQNDKTVAIDRLLKRGKWGGATSPVLTDEDRPLIEGDFAAMEAIIEQRPNAIKISLENDDPATTYKKLLQIVEP